MILFALSEFAKAGLIVGAIFLVMVGVFFASTYRNSPGPDMENWNGYAD